MRLLKTIALSFAMFSAIPLPTKKIEWSEENMRYMLCSFSLVGVVIALVWLAADYVFARYFPSSQMLRAAILTAIPVLITGGIHLDGFCDTVDALSSHREREKKLEILKDSHCGAFALIYTSLYLVVYAFAVCDIKKIDVPLCAVFVLERLLSALSVATFPLAKSSGLVHTFASASAKRIVAFFCALCFVLLSSALIVFYALSGFAVVATSFVVFIGYYVIAKKEFGGITGDISGAFVQVTEICAMIVYCFVKSL